MKPFVFVDFDETLTTKDTISLLADAARAASGGSKTPFSSLVDAYMRDYRETLAKDPVTRDKDPVVNKKNECERLRSVELASLARVGASGVLRGLTRAQWREQARVRVQLRPHALQTLQNDVHPDRLFIVSLNWSKDWIHGALHGLPRMDHLFCNDLAFDTSSDPVSTGYIMPEIVDSLDKLRAIRDAVPPNASFIYIGDSGGDLMPLLNSHIGIILAARDSTLVRDLEACGRTVHEDIDPSLVENGKSALFRVDDWESIAHSRILAMDYM
ncbi:hypothetical protein BC940DRAFT_335314 [Gongronella butleri]|nr:hypothetical protein BC940DRAFT_335314 [Gongronella butleri]